MIAIAFIFYATERKRASIYTYLWNIFLRIDSVCVWNHMPSEEVLLWISYSQVLKRMFCVVEMKSRLIMLCSFTAIHKSFSVV